MWTSETANGNCAFVVVAVSFFLFKNIDLIRSPFCWFDQNEQKNVLHKSECESDNSHRWYANIKHTQTQKTKSATEKKMQNQIGAKYLFLLNSAEPFITLANTFVWCLHTPHKEPILFKCRSLLTVFLSLFLCTNFERLLFAVNFGRNYLFF